MNRLFNLRRKLSYMLSALLFTIMGNSLTAQVTSVGTICGATNSQNGVMFNVTAPNADIIIQRIWVQENGASNVNIHYREGGYVNDATDPGWNLRANADLITGTSTCTDYFEADEDVDLLIPQGETYGIWIEGTNGSINYQTVNPAVDQTIFADADSLIIIDVDGHGGGPPTLTFNPRAFAGQIDFIVAQFGPNDAGVAEILSPQEGFCPGVKDFDVKIQNYGTNQIDSLQLFWEIDNVLYDTVLFDTPLLDTSGGTGSHTLDIHLAELNFTSGQGKSLAAWTSMPNNQPDTINFNDTARISIQPSLSGNFDIGGGNNDYADIVSALDDLNDFGICGPTTLNVYPGVYTDRLTIGEIAGADSNNTLTIRGVNKDSSIIQYSTSVSAERAAIEINGAKYVTIEDLTIHCTQDLSFGWNIWMTGGASHINILNNTIINDTTGASNNYNCIIASGSPTSVATTSNNAENVLIKDNFIKGGYYGVRLNGSSTTIHDQNNVVEKNVFRLQYYYSMYMRFQGNFYLDGNDVDGERLTGSTTTFQRSIYLSSCNEYYEITNNRVVNVAYSSIHLTGCDPTGTPALIANNALGGGFSNSSATAAGGIYMTSSTNIDIIGNSIYHDEPGGNGIRQAGTLVNNIRLINNSIFHDGSTGNGYAINFNSNSALTESDYNLLHSNSSNFVSYGVDYADLSAYQTATNLDANSLSADPEYTAVTDLFPETTSPLIGAGTNFARVSTDKLGVPRGSSATTIGAYEIPLVDDDAGVSEITRRISGNCGAELDSVVLTVGNFGLESQTNIPVTVEMTGLVDTTFTLTIAEMAEVSFTDVKVGAINTANGGTLNVLAYTSLAGDEDNSNDTATASFQYDAIPDAPIVSADTMCEFRTIELSASSSVGTAFNWYANLGDRPNESLSSNAATFETGIIRGDTTFYVSITDVCESAKSALEIITQPNPQTSFDRVEPFNGTEGDGTIGNPDSICVRDTMTYELLPPSGLTNADFGTEWVVTELSIKTLGGADALNADISNPGMSNGRLQYVSSSQESDSILEVRAVVNLTATGCDTVITNYIYVIPTPDAEFEFDNVCLGSEVRFENQSQGVDMEFEWHFGDASNSSSMDVNPRFTYADSGDYDVHLRVVSGGICADDISKEVRVYPKPTAAFTVEDVCEVDTLPLSNNSSIGSGIGLSYAWEFGDGTSSTEEEPIKQYETFANEMRISLRVTSDDGCEDVVEEQIEVFVNARADFSVAGICETDTFVFSNLTEYALDNSSLTHRWELGDGTQATTEELSHFYVDGYQDYEVVLETETPEGCISRQTEVLSVVETPMPDFEVGLLCAGNIGELLNRTAYESEAEELRYEWYFGTEESSVREEPRYRFREVGDITVRLRAIARTSGCSAEEARMLNVNASPEVDYGLVEEVCRGTEVSFADASTIAEGRITAYAWDLGDGSVENQESFSYTYGTAGMFNVNLVATSDAGCVDSAMRSIQVNELPTATFTTTQRSGDEFEFLPTNRGLDGYRWSFGDGVESEDMMPIHQFESNDNYEVSLSVVDFNGCENEFMQELNVMTVGMGSESRYDFNAYAYPNPFDRDFTLAFELSEASMVSIDVFDALGKRIAQEAEHRMSAGKHIKEVTQLQDRPAGIYFVKLAVEGEVVTIKMVKTNR